MYTFCYIIYILAIMALAGYVGTLENKLGIKPLNWKVFIPLVSVGLIITCGQYTRSVDESKDTSIKCIEGQCPYEQHIIYNENDIAVDTVYRKRNE